MASYELQEIERLPTLPPFESNWKGRLTDGRFFRAHYRGGWFAFGVGQTDDDALCNLNDAGMHIENVGGSVHIGDPEDYDEPTDFMLECLEEFGVRQPMPS